MRIAVNSPAFRECLQNVMAHPTQLGLPGESWVSGPYYPCSADPGPPTVDAVMGAVLSSNGTVLSCDYHTIGTNTGGYANIGNIDASGREVLTFGNELGSLTAPIDCNYNPDGLPCTWDGAYQGTASTIAHEIMHTHGYTHVGDIVWNLNDVNVGDVGHYAATATQPASTHMFTLGDFCGVMPSYTPGNGGNAPSMPTATPSPGVHPTYGSGIPYEVGQCVDTVLAWSEASGHMHDDCGPWFAGLRIVDTVMSGSPSTATLHCVSDPYRGARYSPNSREVLAPIPPHAPTCTMDEGCSPTYAAGLHCDDNPNLIHLERRPHGSTGPWVRSATYSAAYDYRACAESIYGKACSVPTAYAAPAPACVTPERLVPYPFWLWYTTSLVTPIASALNDTFGGAAVQVLPVPLSQATQFPSLGAGGGDLSKDFGALGIGVYDANIGAWVGVGPSVGALPPVHGTAFAMVVGADKLPHVLGFGGDVGGTPLANVYDGAIALAGDKTSTKWARYPMSGPAGRTHAAVTANLAGDTAYMFGGTTAQGAVGDLWAYGVAKGQWTPMGASLAAARSDSAVALDGTRLVVFGGRDGKGNLLGDLSIVDLATGKLQTFTTTAVPRANAAVAVQQGLLHVYGGDTGKGASDVLEVISLADGKTQSSRHVGWAGLSGASITVDDAEAITLVPGFVPGAKIPGGALLGTADSLVLIQEQ